MNDNLAKEKQPEFNELILRFRNELATMEDHSDNILSKIYAIKDTREPQPNHPDEEDLPITESSILDNLISCYNTLKYHNNTLKQARQQLGNLVG